MITLHDIETSMAVDGSLSLTLIPGYVPLLSGYLYDNILWAINIPHPIVVLWSAERMWKYFGFVCFGNLDLFKERII